MRTSWLHNSVTPVDPRSAARLLIAGRHVSLGETKARAPKRLYVAPKGHCRECHRVVPKGRFTWCGQACVDASGLNWNQTRANVFRRDNQRCHVCGVDIKESMRWWDRIRWALKSCRNYNYEIFDAAMRECGWNTHTNDQRQADHIVARADGGSDHPDNLRTLCVPCHKERTALQHRDWADERRKRNSLFGDAAA